MAEVGNTNQIEMNNSQQSSVKTCKKCGAVLPLDEFYKRKNSSDGHTPYCKKCHNAMCSQYKRNKIQKLEQKGRQELLQEFTSRELILELKRRGYEGKLQYVEVHNIDISKLI